jgi:hypothetical protein
MRANRRRLLGIGAAVATALAALLVVASYALDEPLRRSVERRMNERLVGYSVQISDLDFRPIDASVQLKNLVIRQDAHPDPPVAVIGFLRARVDWQALLARRLVADFLLERPVLYVNLPQLHEELSDQTSIQDRGWQDAFEQIYPLKINSFRVWEGEVTYIDTDPERPLRLRDVRVDAQNIRNVELPDRTYPSTVEAQAVVFDQGRALIDGEANFLTKPFPSVNVALALENVPLDGLRPVALRSNLEVRGGTVDLHGYAEITPRLQALDFADLSLRDVHLDYRHMPDTAHEEKQQVQEVAKVAKEAVREPETSYQLRRLTLERCELGFVNAARDPSYRVFLAPADATVVNLSTELQNGPAIAQIQGRFMGKGPASATAELRAAKDGPDLDLKVAIEDTPLPALNDVLRAYGKFDVVAGSFAFYADVRVAHDRIDGYVKPLFENMEVYDRRQDAEKSVFRRLYERIVGGLAELLRNRDREEVATKANISGPVDNPRASTLEVIVRLIQNAFFREILPGFDEQLARGDHRERGRG